MTGTIPSQINLYELGGGTPSAGTLNVPRSMAIAYNTIKINGASIHLTELRTESVSGRTFSVNGWSQTVRIKIYGFCKIDDTGVPNTAAPAFVIDLNPIPADTTPGSPIALGGSCTCQVFPEQLVGCMIAPDEDHVFLAVTVQVTAFPVLPSPPWPTGSSVNIHSRTISVTIHGEQDEQSGMLLSDAP